MTAASFGPAGADEAVVPLPAARRILAQAVIMVATSTVILDQTIATVALPHMQAALGATPETISWVLTSYILASAVAIPITGWLSGLVGRRMLFTASILIFSLSSAMCAFSVSLPMMVLARFVQGFSGAFMVPMSQSFMLDLNRPSHQMRALAIWGMGIMVAPIAGPVLGGYLTDTFDWRWIFLINVPLGIAAFVGLLATLPDMPSYLRPFDRPGFVMILVGLCSLQLMLDRGTQQDWFESTEIIIYAGICAGAFWMLGFHLKRARSPIIAIELFRDRNFLASILLGFIVSPIAVASAAMMPQMMQVLLGYPVMTAGLLIIPRGLSLMLSMVIGPRLERYIDSRLVLVSGLLMMAFSMYLQTKFSLDMGMDLIIWSGLLQGIGLGLAVATGNRLSMANLPVHFRTEGAAIYMLARSIGGSILISIMSALLAYNVQTNHEEIGSRLTSHAMPLLLPGLSDRYGISSATFTRMADLEVNRQAMMIAYIDDFWLMMWLTLIVMPVVLFVKPVKPVKGESVIMAD